MQQHAEVEELDIPSVVMKQMSQGQRHDEKVDTRKPPVPVL